MIKGMPLTYNYLKDKYSYLRGNSSKKKILTVLLNDKLYLLEINNKFGLSLLEFSSVRYVVCKFYADDLRSRIIPLITFFDDLKLVQVANEKEDPEEIEFDNKYKEK